MSHDLMLVDDTERQAIDKYDRFAVESFLFGPYAAVVGLAFIFIRRAGFLFRFGYAVADLLQGDARQVKLLPTVKQSLMNAIPAVAEIEQKRAEQQHAAEQQKQQEQIAIKRQDDLAKMVKVERERLLNSDDFLQTIAKPAHGGNLHLTINGSSGSGKSVLFWHVGFLRAKMGMEIHVIDMQNYPGKWGYAATSRGFGAGGDVAGFEDAAITLNYFEVEYLARDKAYQQGMREFPPLILKVDESHMFNDSDYECSNEIREQYQKIRKRLGKNGRKLGMGIEESTIDNLADSTGGTLEFFRNFAYVVEVVPMTATKRRAILRRYLGRGQWRTISSHLIPKLYDPDDPTAKQPTLPKTPKTTPIASEPSKQRIEPSEPPQNTADTANIRAESPPYVPMTAHDVVYFLRQTNPVTGYDKIANLGLIVGSHGERKIRIKDIESSHEPSCERPTIEHLQAWLLANVDSERVMKLKLEEKS